MSGLRGPSRGSSVLGGAAWQTAAQVVPLVINLALTPYVISQLGATAYGLWLVSSTVTQFMAQFDGGIGRSAQRYFSLYAGSGDRARATSLLLTLLLAILVISIVFLAPVFAFTPHLVSFFKAPRELEGDMTFLLRVLIVLVAVGLARNLFAGVLNAHSRFSATAGTLLVGYVVYAAGLATLLHLGYGLRQMAYVFIAQQTVATLLIIPSSLKYLTRSHLKLLRIREIAEFGRFAWKAQFAGVLAMLSFQGVILVVARLAHRQVSSFGPGSTFAYQIRTLAMNAILPVQSALGRHVGEVGEVAAIPYFDRAQRLWVILVAGLVAVGAPAAYFGVNIWLPLTGSLAGEVAATLLISHFFALVPQVLLIWLMLIGRPELEVIASSVTVVLVLTGSVLLVPAVGAIGVGIASVAANVVGYFMLAWLIRRVSPRIRAPLASLPWLPALAAAALAAFGAGLVSRTVAPAGGAGLIACGIAALPALGLYAQMTVGLRRGIGLIRSLRTDQSS